MTQMTTSFLGHVKQKMLYFSIITASLICVTAEFDLKHKKADESRTGPGGRGNQITDKPRSKIILDLQPMAASLSGKLC